MVGQLNFTLKILAHCTYPYYHLTPWGGHIVPFVFNKKLLKFFMHRLQANFRSQGKSKLILTFHGTLYMIVFLLQKI